MSRPPVGFCDWSNASAQEINRFIDTVIVQRFLRLTCHVVLLVVMLLTIMLSLTNCIKTAVEASITVTKFGHNDYNFPGWTDNMSQISTVQLDKLFGLDGSRQAWKWHVIPACTRDAFKQALTYCKRQAEGAKQADACARSCANKDRKQFWKNVSKIANKKSPLLVRLMCNMWKDYFIFCITLNMIVARGTYFSVDPPACLGL